MRGHSVREFEANSDNTNHFGDRLARRIHCVTPQHWPNKALHPTAYSFVPFARASLRSLRFRRRVSLIVVLLRLLNGNPVSKSTPELRRTFRRWLLALVLSASRTRLKVLWCCYALRVLVHEYSCGAVCFACRSSSSLWRGLVASVISAAGTSQQQHNKALHPTAYSFGFPLVPRSKPTLPAAGELGRCAVAQSLIGRYTCFNEDRRVEHGENNHSERCWARVSHNHVLCRNATSPQW